LKIALIRHKADVPFVHIGYESMTQATGSESLLIDIREVPTGYFFKELTEMGIVVEAQLPGNFFHTGSRQFGLADGFQCYSLPDVKAGGFTGYLLYDLVEVIGGYQQHTGILSHFFIAPELLFYQCIESMDQYVPIAIAAIAGTVIGLSH
jgi:hypothetical protein